MTLAFPVVAVTVAAVWGWPASALTAAFGRSGLGPPPWLTALIMAALALAVTLRLHPVLVATAGCWLVLWGVPLAAIDVMVRRLPDALTGACFAGLAGLLTAAAALTGQWQDLARAGAGAAATALLFALLALARPGSAGLGDAKLALSTGGLAAWFGWGMLLTSVFAAFGLAAAYGLGLLVTRRAYVTGYSLPFGPFLLAGCVALVLVAGSAG
jgi:leader peptidase (prepilin peptidase) / N-methyltransferase